MNNIIKVIKSSIIAGIIILATSCEKDLDVAPMLTFDGQANMTIAELLTYHDIGSLDSFDSIPAGTIIEGTIISSDEHGNCYKYLNIQDATGGIQIKVDNSSLYYKYGIGQHVYVKCDGLVIGDYRKCVQLGWWVDGAMAGISSSKEGQYIFRDGEVGAEPAATVITSKNDIQDNHYNCLVKLEDCYFKDAGTTTYASASSSESRTIVMGDGTEIVLRTSNYADFALTTLPEGTGNIYGILTRYNTTPQLIIRSLADVKIVNVAPVYSVNFSQNPLSNGWTNLKTLGADWRYINSTVYGQLLTISGDEDGNDSWLVSPAINLSSYRDVTLSFTHQVANVNTQELKLYYSTTYSGGAIDMSEWTEITIPNYPTGFAETDIPLDNNIISNPNLRIAYRYAASGGEWSIKRIDFKTIVLQ